MRTIIIAIAMAIATAFSAVPVAAEEQVPDNVRWTGVVAVKESPVVNDIVRLAGNNPAVYGMMFRKGLEEKTPGIEPAPGKYCFMPYESGEPIDEPFCITTKTGFNTFWAPEEFFRPGRAMCLKVPDDWDAIAAQKQFPEVGGHLVNCRDWDDEVNDPSFASSRDDAEMVVAIKPAN